MSILYTGTVYPDLVKVSCDVNAGSGSGAFVGNSLIDSTFLDSTSIESDYDDTDVVPLMVVITVEYVLHYRKSIDNNNDDFADGGWSTTMVLMPMTILMMMLTTMHLMVEITMKVVSIPMIEFCNLLFFLFGIFLPNFICLPII